MTRPKPEAQNIATQSIVSVDNLIHYWRSRKGCLLGSPLFDGLTFRIGSAERLCLFGPNGAGKTTLIRILAGLVEPTRGEVSICGERNPLRWSSRVGVLIGDERSHYWRLSTRENLMFFGGLHGLSRREISRRIEDLAEAFGLGVHLGLEMGRLSSGLRRRTALVRALLHRPRLVLLDEPCRSLDSDGAHALRETLESLGRCEGTAALITTPRAEVAAFYGGRLAELRGGKLLHDRNG